MGFLMLTSYNAQKKPDCEVAVNTGSIEAIYFYNSDTEPSAVVYGNGFSFRIYDTLQIEI